MTTPADPIAAFWDAWLQTLPEDQRPTSYTAWRFGDSPALADELGFLVRDGIKTATCGLLWEYEYDGEPIPEVGQFSVILDGRDAPLCIIETIEITHRPYDRVDAAFAYDEGEDDRSLRSWREGHWRFFSRSCERIGRDIALDMPLVCERFRLVYPRPEHA